MDALAFDQGLIGGEVAAKELIIADPVDGQAARKPVAIEVIIIDEIGIVGNPAEVEAKVEVLRQPKPSLGEDVGAERFIFSSSEEIAPSKLRSPRANS